MRERIVITGAAGFIGSALAEKYVGQGAEVHALVRPSTVLSGRLASGVTIHRVDLTDRSALGAVLTAASPTTVFHLATNTGRALGNLENAAQIVKEEQTILLSLLLATAKLARPPSSFVRSGSLAEYGSGPTPSHEGQRERPIGAYAAALSAGTLLVAALQPQLPFAVRTARLGLTYGPRQSLAYLIPWLIEQCLTGRAAFIHAPEQRRDLIYLDDVVSGLIALAQTQQRGATLINLSTGLAPTMREAALLVAQTCGSDPHLLSFGDGSAEGAPQIVCGNPSKAGELLGWRATWSLDAGLRRTIGHMRHERAAA